MMASQLDGEGLHEAHRDKRKRPDRRRGLDCCSDFLRQAMNGLKESGVFLQRYSSFEKPGVPAVTPS